MTNRGIIKEILDNNMALVEVRRESACGHDCASCKGCGDGAKLSTVIACNDIGAGIYDDVIINASTGKILKGAMYVYIIPLILFFIGYFIFGNFSGTLGTVFGILGFIIGIIYAIIYSKKIEKSGEINFNIINKL